jgi:hypothetical protein
MFLGPLRDLFYESSCLVVLMGFHERFPYELSWFLTQRRVPCEMSCFLAGKVPYEAS